MKSLLITQCLQHDFLGPIGRHDPLPNPLHVGYSESLRMLGEDPREGPLARTLRSCLEDPELAMIHVRDYHDLDDPAQRAEMELFGAHCVAGTPGVEFIAGLHEELVNHPRSHVVNSTSLNDTLEGTLSGLLQRLAEPTTRIGVVGVWTDVKIHYLLYELRTRYGFENLAVCSALVASRQRRRHFEALEHFKSVLRVRVFDAPGGFLEWLGARPEDSTDLTAPEPPAPELVVHGEDPELATAGSVQRRLLKHLFRDCKRVELTPLGGGFSGSKVVRTQSEDALGYKQAPFVVKLDRRDRIATERARFEQVENILGQNAPQVREVADLGEHSAIKYLYATMGRRSVRTLKSFLEDLPAGEEGHRQAVEVLEDVLESVLSRLYGHRTTERFHFFQYYSFLPRYAENTLKRAEAAYGGPIGDELCIGGVHLPSPRAFYSRVGELEDPPVESAASWIHGDLNYANVLLDDSRNYWIIDFYHTAYGHAVQDLAKLENDLKFILTPLGSPEDLAAAVRLEVALATGSPPPAQLPPPIERCARLVGVLRNWAMRLLGEDPGDSYRIALLRYSAHTLSFDESGPLQKKLALASTGLLSHRFLEGSAEIEAKNISRV